MLPDLAGFKSKKTRAPLKPLPEVIARWTSRARWLRWLDFLILWIVLWANIALAFTDLDGRADAILAAVLTAGGTLIPMFRRHWRPATALVALVMSRRLRPGDRAWHIRPGEAELVLVTARRRLSVVIANQTHDSVEGVLVSRTQALLIPADPVETRSR